jgi:hypothetical protein
MRLSLEDRNTDRKSEIISPRQQMGRFPFHAVIRTPFGQANQRGRVLGCGIAPKARPCQFGGDAWCTAGLWRLQRPVHIVLQLATRLHTWDLQKFA